MPSVWTVIRLICISYINFTSITALQDAHCAISRSNDYSYVSNLIGCLRCLIITKIIVYIVRLYTNCVNLSQIAWLSTNQMWIHFLHGSAVQNLKSKSDWSIVVPKAPG